MLDFYIRRRIYFETEAPNVTSYEDKRKHSNGTHIREDLPVTVRRFRVYCARVIRYPTVVPADGTRARPPPPAAAGRRCRRRPPPPRSRVSAARVLENGRSVRSRLNSRAFRARIAQLII
ncbi:hypothetical protein EVAR_78195_1 [Eumeta japonica]|uniref:Uncharacterized protein n=1 Tax=Eumeta variegata TaxID=151549 RepID=A0A4C1UYS5_EUMVA|nr:hypothetical protein EVAR_78195_1 [Eumeta japonica]